MEIIIVLGSSNIHILKERVSRVVQDFFSSPYMIEDVTGVEIITKKILVSGCGLMYYRELYFSESELMKHLLNYEGIHEDYIIIENNSKNTIQNLEFSKKIIDNEFFAPLVTICTSNFHLNRVKVLAHIILGQDYKLRFIDTEEEVSERREKEEWEFLIQNLKKIL